MASRYTGREERMGKLTRPPSDANATARVLSRYSNVAQVSFPWSDKNPSISAWLRSFEKDRTASARASAEAAATGDAPPVVLRAIAAAVAVGALGDDDDD